MAVPYGRHKVGGLELSVDELQFREGPWPYEVQEEHNHDCMRQPRAGSNPARVIQARDGCMVVTFHDVNAVTLYAGTRGTETPGRPSIRSSVCGRPPFTTRGARPWAPTSSRTACSTGQPERRNTNGSASRTAWAS